MASNKLNENTVKRHKRLGGMFTESKLIHKLRDVNIAQNPRNIFQRENYSSQLSKPSKSPFDNYQKDKLLEKYFGPATERDYCLMVHTKGPQEAKFIKTCSTITKNINKLQQLGNRAWSCSCDIQDVRSLSQISFKPRTALKSEISPLPSPKTGLLTPLPKSAASMTRTLFQAKSNTALIENTTQRLLYHALKGNKNTGTMQCGTKPFENIERCTKPYTTSTETFNASWVDAARVQSTSNHESSKFDIISHGYGRDANVRKLLHDNPRACNKIKSIAEYSDLTKVTAAKPNKVYQEVAKKYPNCFTKSTALCARQADFGKTYGPFFKLFK